ncbi:MAG TPA: universal stress protein [Flavobacteriaceae bacterium]|nr:universal stress protein [Flavobacteriaceae bacterium]
MKNILVPIGSSPNAGSNLQYAIDLAHEVDANVYVISIFQEMSKVGGMTKVNAIMKADVEKRLEEVMASVDKKEVSVVAHPIKGEVIDGIIRFNKHIPVDLMVISPRSNAISEEVYLGKISGKLVKETNIPILVVPEGSIFKKPKTMLMAFKNGNFNKKKTLSPVRQFVDFFKMKLNVLHVETPETSKNMKQVSENLKAIMNNYEQVQNATTFQAVLEYFHSYEPDILCVVRRKRGFFQKLMEKNVILKKEFHTSKPLLVLQVQE